MASSTIWWKDGDSEHVVPNKTRMPKTLELCPLCGAAYGIHGKVGDVLVHPGDKIIVNKGKVEVVHPDPFADAR